VGRKRKAYRIKLRDGVGQNLGRCQAHDKKCLPTRKEARQLAAKQFSDHHMSVYRCDETNFYHVGGLPESVIRGTITRGEIYG
jgi:hypothetical protein